MSLYPSFQKAESEEIRKMHNLVSPDVISDVPQKSDNMMVQQLKQLYPVVEYMGLDLTKHGYNGNGQEVALKNNNAQITPAVKGQVTGDLKQLTLCKDSSGKVGILVSEVNKGIFVSFVLKGSPAALVGLKFGDQILQLNDTILAGFPAERVHKMIKKCGVNGIHLIVRDRPFERNVTLVKDVNGQVGFQFSKGRIFKLFKDSSAARNGLVTGHNLLEVQGQNVVGLEDQEIVRIIENAGPVVTITVVPSFIYEQMMKKINVDFLKSMDHTVHF